MFNLFILASWKDSYFLFDITTNNKTNGKRLAVGYIQQR